MSYLIIRYWQRCKITKLYIAINRKSIVGVFCCKGFVLFGENRK